MLLLFFAGSSSGGPPPVTDNRLMPLIGVGPILLIVGAVLLLG